MPQRNIPHPNWLIFPNADKCVHALFYSVLFLFIHRAFLILKRPTALSAIINFIICLIYGLMIELAQHYLTPDRAFEWLDLSGNSLGALFGWMLSMLLPKKIFFAYIKI
jgi:VanZ family protein